MDVEESTVQTASPAPPVVVAPKRSRKKKLKFDDSPHESLTKVFLRIAGGQEVSLLLFFVLARFPSETRANGPAVAQG